MDLSYKMSGLQDFFQLEHPELFSSNNKHLLCTHDGPGTVLVVEMWGWTIQREETKVWECRNGREQKEELSWEKVIRGVEIETVTKMCLAILMARIIAAIINLTTQGTSKYFCRHRSFKAYQSAVLGSLFGGIFLVSQLVWKHLVARYLCMAESKYLLVSSIK